MGARPLRDAGHRRLRPFGWPQRAPQSFRSRRQACRVCLAACTRRGRRHRQGHAQERAGQARPRSQQAGPAESMSTVEIRVPDMGNFESVTVIDVLVKVGDTIDIDTPLATLETDKATMDVPSTAKGVVEKLHIEKGGKVSTGALIVTVKAATGQADTAPARPASAAAAGKPADPPPASTAPSAAPSS